MSLIVEDGTIVPGANSYATAAEATQYFADRGITITLADADMITATDFIDTVYGNSFRGSLLDADTQSLLWPRTSFTDAYGRTYASGSVPELLKVSVYHAAKLNLEGDSLLSDTNESNMLQSFTKTVEGAVSKSETYFAPVNRKKSSYIGKLLTPLLAAATSGRLVRA